MTLALPNVTSPCRTPICSFLARPSPAQTQLGRDFFQTGSSFDLLSLSRCAQSPRGNSWYMSAPPTSVLLGFEAEL